MTKRLLLSLTGLLVCMMTFALVTPEEGKYYRIINQNPEKSVNTGGQSYGYAITENTVNNKLTAEAQAGDTKYNQLWKYTKGKLQNAHTQRYFPSLNISQAGFTNTYGQTITLEDKGKYFLIKAGNQVHADGSNTIVGWNDANNQSNWWCFEEVTVDADALKAVQDLYAEQQDKKHELEAIAAKEKTYAPIVEGYFSDGACTQLKDEFKSMTDEAFAARMTSDNLPAEIQQMVLNIKNEWKDEHNPVLSKRFRVQDYKVYTRCQGPKDKWVSTQMADMNNPTGIYTSSLQLMYVFVEGDIPEGTTLKIAGAEGSEITLIWDWDGTPLHKGLNILYCGTDFTNQWIMYTCEADYAKPLSEYPDLKIHIEGGKVIGYCDVDYTQTEDAVNADYTTVLENAKSVLGESNWNKINFTVKGERGVMVFPIDCFNDIWSSKTTWGSKIYKSMKFYDDVLKWEWSAMGWQSRVESGEGDNELEHLIAGGGEAIYPEYVNNLAPTMMLYQGKNPYSGNSYTCMPGIWAVESSYNGERANFDVWCVGHESGHNNQHTINLPSSMESSNNYFSNLITTMYGYRMSRGWNFMSNLNYVQNNIIFSHRDISITLRMYYNLWLYYHRAGHNKQFTQRLHKLLRADRMQFGGEGWHNGAFGGANKGSARNSWLKFYEKACEAAGEDLTEYFRLWGFFIPTSKAGGSIEKIDGKYYAYCGDYSSYYIRCEQSDIDAAIKRVKSKGYRVNKEILFIEDRQKLQQRHDPWAQPGDMKPDNGGTLRTEEWLRNEYGDLGYYEDYKAGQESKAQNYSFVANGTNVTLTGEGGVGILVYNGDDIVYYSNKLSFNLPAKVALTDYTIKVIGGDGTELEAVDATEGGKAAQGASILQEVINKTTAYTGIVDETGTKVGFFTPNGIANLNAAIAAAQAAIQAGESSRYATLCESLESEMAALNGSEGKNPVEESGIYTLHNVAFNNYLASGALAIANGSLEEARWNFVPVAGQQDVYRLQNVKTLKFANVATGDGFSVDASLPGDALELLVEDKGNGQLALKTVGGVSGNYKEKNYVHQTHYDKMMGWSDGNAGGSKWYITKVDDIDVYTKADVQGLINDTKSLIAQVGTLTQGYEKLALQASDKTAPYYVSTNKANTQYPITNLVDDDKTTDFYSKRETSSSTPHNFTVNLGAGNAASQMRLTIFAANNGLQPKTIKAIPGESALKFYEEESTLWEEIPQLDAQKAKALDTKEVSKPYQYWRFQVLEVYGSTSPQFALSEIQLRTLNTALAYNPGYEGVAKNLVTDADNAQKAAANKIAILSTPLTNVTVYDTLKTAYDALKAAADEATDIEGITLGETKAGEGIYDLSGRRVSKPAKAGIYVVNGKKIVK